MAYSLPFLSLMTFSDFLIIYLACGAPFGVFFFLQNRNKKNSSFIYLQSFGLVFVWIPYAIRLLHDFITRHFWQSTAKNPVGNTLENLEKQISQLVFDSDSKISLFEFREIFERYTGLTLAHHSADDLPSKTDEEIFRVALRQNIKLGAACLHRRNRLRIERHQISARQDFLQIVSEVSHTVSEQHRLRDLTVQFVTALNDTAAIRDLDEIFKKTLQRQTESYVQQLEKDLWTDKGRQHKQSTAGKLPLRLRALTVSRKD